MKKMKITISALIVKLDLQQNGLAKTFQQNNPKPLPPQQAPTPQPLHEFRSPRPDTPRSVSTRVRTGKQGGSSGEAGSICIDFHPLPSLIQHASSPLALAGFSVL